MQKRARNYGIAFKLNALILTVSCIIFLCASLFNYYSTRRLLVEETRDDIEIVGEITAQNIGKVISSSEVIANTLAALMKKGLYLRESVIVDNLISILQANPHVFGASVTFAPYAYDKTIKFYSPYVCRVKDGIKVIDDINDTNDYTNLPWYSDAAKKGDSCWIEPYFEKDADNAMIFTYSVPFFAINNGKKELRGVALVDISLDWLNNLLKDVNVYGSGYAFILSKTGRIIYSPSSEFLPEHLCKYTISEYAKIVNNPAIADLGSKMLSGKKGFSFVSTKWVNKTGWFYYAPIGQQSGWSLAIFFPDDKFKEDIKRLNFEIFLICLTGVVLLMILIFFITNKLTSPLRKLTHSVKAIGRGYLDKQIEVSNANDEVGILTRSFEDMRKSLINYIENLKRTTAEKESYETEIKIAASLQASVLPVVDDKFKSNLFDIYINLVPAKDVSGDFYDIFYLNDSTLALVVADVSGKGVPAAFFMSMAKFAIKNICNTIETPAPGKVLEIVNNLICAENSSCMFVTCYLIFYDIKTGQLRYANAGHHGFIHMLSGGQVEKKGVFHNKAIGVFPGEKYSNSKILLEKDESIAIYTDGVFEASNKEDIQFGEDRVIEHFIKNRMKPIKNTGESLINDVMEFENHHRFDDITLLILKRT